MQRQPEQTRVATPEHSYLLTDILKDNEARTPAFGANSCLQIGRPAAVKTGTTNDVRDIWTIGYTPQLAVGVWVGNADGTPMDRNLSGIAGAGPIWNRFMRAALGRRRPAGLRPAGRDRAGRDLHADRRGGRWQPARPTAAAWSCSQPTSCRQAPRRPVRLWRT